MKRGWIERRLHRAELCSRFGMLGDCVLCSLFRMWRPQERKRQAEEQKVKLGHLNLYLKVHPIHRSQLRGRLGLESYL